MTSISTPSDDDDDDDDGDDGDDDELKYQPTAISLTRSTWSPSK